MAFKMFENSKPTVESIVLLAILVAIAVLGRLLLLSIPGIQAGSFIIIMVGVVYGREEGFLVGALAALVGDLFVGIGYWAVFQMLGWGLMGSNLLYRNKTGIGTYTCFIRQRYSIRLRTRYGKCSSLIRLL